MIRKSVLAATMAALLTPVAAGALGLGNIEVTSGLNEPLRARIPVRGADPGELEELRARLGDDQQFQRAGIDRPFVLTKLRFKVVERSARSGFIEVTTREPVNEPFLNFLVDVSWSRGRVLREYTMLLDPPVYGAAITSAARTLQTVPATPSLAPAPAPAPAPAQPMAAPAPAAVAGTPRYIGDSYGPVRDGETLWSIATRVRPVGTSIQSMMLALLKANPEAFTIDNINALRSGAVLRIPPASAIEENRAAALAEVASQHALWEEYRQSLTGAVTAQPGGAAPAGTAPAVTAPTAPGPAADAGEDAAELKLVGAGTSGTTTGGGAAVEEMRNELTMAQEEAEAAKRQNEELRSRLDEAETLVDDLKRLVQLKEDQLADLQNQLAEAPAPKPPVATEPPAPTPAPPVTPQPPAPAPKPVVTPPPAPQPTSFLDEVNAMLPVPLWGILAGIGALLLGLGGMRWARGRKAAAEAEAEEEVLAAGEDITEESLVGQYAQTDLGDEEEEEAAEAVTEVRAGAEEEDATTATATELPEDLVEAETFEAGTGTARLDAEEEEGVGTAPGDEEDPLAEVNVYLAYERFDQAEQLVRDAVATYPDRHEYRLKLLEVFYAAKNVGAFEAAAAELQSVVGADSEMMRQAEEWWAEMETRRALFGAEVDAGVSTETGVGGDTEMFDVTVAGTGTEVLGEQTGVDFDLGFEGTDEAAAGTDSGLDFDLTADDSEGSSSVDFDLGGFEEAAGAASGELDLDLSAAEAEAVDAGRDTGLDFDLGGLGEGTEELDDATVKETPAPLPERVVGEEDSGLDFDLAALDGDDAGEGADSRTQVGDDEMSLDFTLDEGVGGQEQLEVGEASADEGALDFDLTDTVTLDDEKMASVRAEAEAALEEPGAAPEGDAAAGGKAPGAGTGLDLDLGEPAADVDIGTDSLALDSGAGTLPELPGTDLDFDLGDTGTKAEEGGAATSGLDLDLGDTGTLVGGDETLDADRASGVDFDLGDTGTKGGEGRDTGLDFDLGDTSSLVEDVAGVGTGEGTSLDFDLGDTSTLGQDEDKRTAAGGGSLDFDLSDTGGTFAEDAQGSGLDFDLGDTGTLGDDSAGSEDLGLDLDLGTGEPTPKVGKDSAIDTVQLGPELAADMRPEDESEGTGIDTEFRGIFPGEGSAEAGTESSLDFDLGTSLDDVPDAEGPGAGGTEEDNHTLVLGRGMSSEVDEMQTKLDLAQAYMDMGDSEGARNLLGEVMAEGSEAQQGQAKEMLGKLS